MRQGCQVGSFLIQVRQIWIIQIRLIWIFFIRFGLKKKKIWITDPIWINYLFINVRFVKNFSP